MIALTPFIVGGSNAVLAFVFAFYIALWLVIDWCFWPRTQRSVNRRAVRTAAREEARRSDYRQRLIASQR